MLQYTAVQRQNAVSAYFTSKQILSFGIALQYSAPLLQRIGSMAVCQA